MSVIKSAWEIAMEKTEHLQADPDKLAKDEKIQEGRKIAAAYLLDHDVTEENTKKKYNAYAGTEKDEVREGMVLALLDNIHLPQDEQYKENFMRVTALARIIGNHMLMQLCSQLTQLFSQYLEQKKQLTDALKQQYRPRLEQKEAQLEQQFGQTFDLEAEQDPEFVKLLSQNLKQLDARYDQVIGQAKTQIRQQFGLDQ